MKLSNEWKSTVTIELTFVVHHVVLRKKYSLEGRVRLQVACVCLLQISETPVISDGALHLTTVDRLFPRSHT